MKAIKAILMSIVIPIALVTLAHAATFAPANSSYSCVSTPAYTSYVKVHPVTCPATGNPLQTPSVMGAW